MRSGKSMEEIRQSISEEFEVAHSRLSDEEKRQFVGFVLSDEFPSLEEIDQLESGE